MTGREKLMMAVCAAMGLSAASAAMGQAVTYGTAGGNYFQDFNTLATSATATGTVTATASWADNGTLAGWYAASSPTAGTAPITTYRVSDGGSNSGAVYSFGAAGDTERALGSVGSGTPRTQWYGLLLQNTSGGVLDKFTLSYTGEEWRQTTGAANSLDFYYSTNNTATGGGTATPVVSDTDRLNPDTTVWTAVAALSFTAPKAGTGFTDGAINGNAAGNKTAISGQVNIAGGWQPGQYLFIRWRDLDNTGNDQGLAVDDLTFSATAPVVTNNGTTLLAANGTKTAATVDLGRVVAGSNTATGNVVLKSTPSSTNYSDLSTDGSTLVPGTGSIATGSGTTIGVRIAGASLPSALIGSDVSRTAVVKNDGNTVGDTTNVSVPVTVHVVGNRFIDNFDGFSGGTAAPVDFGKMLVGSSKTLSVDLSTVNTGDLSSATLTTLTLQGATAPTGQTANDAFAQVALAAGTGDVVFDDGTDTATRSVTLTPLKSGQVIAGTTNTGGVRTTSYLSVPIQVTDTAVGATGDARVYVMGDFFAPAGVTGNATAVAPGGTVTLTNAPPSADSTSGKRLAADILGTSFDQSGWSVSGLPSLIGPARAQYTSGGTTFAAVISTVTGTIALDTTGKLNGTYGATLSVALQNNDQGQGVYGVAANDLPATTVPVSGTVSDKPAVQNGAYTLNGGTLSAPATNLTGSFTQSGGTSTFASVIGGGSVTVSGGSLVLSPGATTNVVKSLSISGSGKVDLTSAKLAIDYTGGTPAGSIRQALLAGSAGGWTGATGLTSSDAAAHTAGSYAIGYAEASLVLGPSGGTWNGASVDGTALLLKETYFGDANLDGKVNADDLSLLDKGFNKHLTAGTAVWTDGDFNYDGTVNAADYLLADTSYAQHGAPLSAEFLAARDAQFGDAYVASLIAAVPEPTSLGLVGVAAAGLFGRRRRSAK